MAAYIIIYLFKVSFAQTIFYWFYAAWLKQQTHFQLNRFYLLFALVISFFIPFLQVPQLNSPGVTATIVPKIVEPIGETSQIIQYYASMPLSYQAPQLQISLGDGLLTIYGLVCLVLFIRFLGRLWKLGSIIRESQKVAWQNHQTLIHPDMPVSSFFSFVFWKKNKAATDHLIWQHERIHISQWHSLDVLLIEVVGILFWFNPLLKLIRTQLLLLHEYIADQVVITANKNTTEYTDLLLAHLSAPIPDLTHHFHSFIKNRLAMIHRKKSSILSILHYLFVVPIFIGLMVLLTSAKDHEIWREAESKLTSMTTLTLDDAKMQELPAPYTIAWGDLKIPVASLPNHPDDNMYGQLSINKEDLLQNLNQPIQVLQASRNQPIKLDFLSIFFNREGKFSGREHIKITLEDNDFIIPAEVREAFTKAQDQMMTSISISHQRKFINFTLQILHPNSRNNFLRIGDRKYIFEPFKDEGLPRLQYLNNSNQTSHLDLIKILNNDKLEIVMGENNTSYQDFDIYFLRDLSAPVAKEYIIEKLTSEKSIVEPIVIITSKKGGNSQIIIFDDDELPIINHKSWVDYFRTPDSYHIRYRCVQEKLGFSWGPLKLYSQNDAATNVAWNTTPFTNEELQENDGVVMQSFIRRMLKAKPDFVLDEKKVGKYNISFRYIDHIGVPFDCILQIEDRKIVGGEKERDEALSRLKEGDFIENLQVYIDGELTMVCRPLKII